MPTHVAFLRAINLGKVRRFPMPELRACLEAAGFADVQTHLATGNVRVSSPMRSCDRVAATMEAAFAADRGFAVLTVVLTPAGLRRVYDDALGVSEEVPEAARRYVALLADDPDPAAVAALEALSGSDAGARVRGRAVHFWLRDGYRRARLDNARVERVLGTTATTRDLNVVTALAQRWGG